MPKTKWGGAEEPTTIGRPLIIDMLKQRVRSKGLRMHTNKLERDSKLISTI